MTTAFGLLLRGIRLGKGLDLPDMATALTTTPDRLRHIETGVAFPPPPSGGAGPRPWASPT